MLTAWTALPMLDRLFDDVMSGVARPSFGGVGPRLTYSPAIDVRANADEIVLVCDVPGLKREDLQVTLEAGTLTIKGQRRYDGGDKDQVWLSRSYGAFEKSFALPDHIEAENVSADLADGVLTVRVPKKPQAKPRRIEIGAGAGHKQLGERKE
ncbi:MAG: Hsp20/alpha crystallin family protein [Polyangiaceae bacterium]